MPENRSSFPKPPPLSEEQKAEILNALSDSGKGFISKLGDKMAASKRPGIRAIVRFFRGAK